MANYTELNAQLIEEFGNLERICNQIYDDHHGVTIYINDMESLSSAASNKISDWNYDLKSLKSIRDKRNRLSHGEVSFSDFLADSTDVNYAINFRKRILSQNDPLSLYQQSLKQTKRSDNHHQVNRTYTPVNCNPPSKRRSVCLYLLIILATIILIAFVLFMIKRFI